MKQVKDKHTLRVQFQLYMSSVMIDYHHHPTKQSIKKAAKAILSQEKEDAKKK